MNRFYNQVKNLIDKKSKSRRYLNSLMTTNKNYSQYKTFKWRIMCYFISTSYGYGHYPYEEDQEKIYNNKNSKLLIKRDYTEDYRWGVARNLDSWAYTNYHFNTPNCTFNFFKDVLIDPAWWQRSLYGYFNCWLWQFGGTSQTPMPENKDTPIRSYIYVTEIN